MTSYWVSTPRYTVRVDVDERGIVRHAAPIVRWAIGRSWAHIVLYFSQPGRDAIIVPLGVGHEEDDQ